MAVEGGGLALGLNTPPSDGGPAYRAVEPGSPSSHNAAVNAETGAATAREVRLDLKMDGPPAPCTEIVKRPLCHMWTIAVVSLVGVLAVTATVVMFCHSFEHAPQHPGAVFRKIANGTCHDHGLHLIPDMVSCEDAAAALGLHDRSAEETPSHITGPAGCYYLTRTSPVHIETLWLNKNHARHASEEGESPTPGLLREPICRVPNSQVPEKLRRAWQPPVPEQIMPEMIHPLPGMPDGIAGQIWGTTTTTTTNTTTETSTSTYTGSSSTTTTFTTTYHKIPTLFCYSVMRVESYELNNIRTQLAYNTSIFGCDDYVLFSDQVLDLKPGLPKPGMGWLLDAPGPTVRTTLLRHNLQTKPKAGSLEGILNTQIFMQAWKQVNEDGRFRHHDWTVKVDPDAVFIPHRLVAHVADIAPASKPVKIYLINCKQSFGLFGALEVISRVALEEYLADFALGDEARCKTELDWTMMGEDLWMRRCFDVLGIEHKSDFGLLSDGYCNDAPSPCVSGKVTFHPFKDSLSYAKCFKEATTMTTTTTTTKPDDEDEDEARSPEE